MTLVIKSRTNHSKADKDAFIKYLPTYLSCSHFSSPNFSTTNVLKHVLMKPYYQDREHGQKKSHYSKKHAEAAIEYHTPQFVDSHKLITQDINHSTSTHIQKSNWYIDMIGLPTIWFNSYFKYMFRNNKYNINYLNHFNKVVKL